MIAEFNLDSKAEYTLQLNLAHVAWNQNKQSQCPFSISSCFRDMWVTWHHRSRDHSIFRPNYRCSPWNRSIRLGLHWYFPIFVFRSILEVINVDSCEKSRRILAVLALPNFRRQGLQKLYPNYHVCLQARRTETFREVIPKVIFAYMLNSS